MIWALSSRGAMIWVVSPQVPIQFERDLPLFYLYVGVLLYCFIDLGIQTYLSSSPLHSSNPQQPPAEARAADAGILPHFADVLDFLAQQIRQPGVRLRSLSPAQQKRFGSVMSVRATHAHRMGFADVLRMRGGVLYVLRGFLMMMMMRWFGERD